MLESNTALSRVSAPLGCTVRPMTITIARHTTMTTFLVTFFNIIPLLSVKKDHDLLF
jgi:hypothetical protein